MAREVTCSHARARALGAARHLVRTAALASLGCAASSDPTSDGEEGGAGGGGLDLGGGASGTTTTGAGGGATTTTSGTTTGSTTGSDGPFGSYGPSDAPPFETASELCAYIDSERASYQGHDRFRGPPWTGEYHQTVTWPLQLAVDASLSAAAQAEALALASGQAPAGQPYSDGSPPPHQYLYVAGVGTDAYSLATEEHPGDWTTDIAGNLTAGITSNNGTARMALFYHDEGGTGPALTRIGCGGAASPGGGRFWVVKMAP